MTAARTRTMKFLVTRPGTDDPVPNWKCSVRLAGNLVGYVDDGTSSPSLTTGMFEDRYFWTDVTGLLTMVLQENVDVVPADTVWSLKIFRSIPAITFESPAGTTGSVAWVGDNLKPDPTNPFPATGVTQTQLAAVEAELQEQLDALPGTYAPVAEPVGAAAQVTANAAVVKANNGSDFADAGSTRANLHVSMLASCQAVATANIALSGTQTIDGYAAQVGDQVLAAGQSTVSQNGPWVVAAGAWTRPADYAHGAAVKGRTVQINAGTLNGGSVWAMTTTVTVTVDTTATAWQISNRTPNDGRYSAQSSALELIAFWVIGHSWLGATINTTPTARWHERVASRLRMGAITNNGVSGFTIGDMSTLALAGARGWVEQTRAFIGSVCTINDLTLFQGSAGARLGYNYAWRALLSLLTSNGVVAATTQTFAYSANWTTETAATSALQGASVNSTSGTRFKTTTVGGTVDTTFTGAAADLVFVARAAGAGLITVTQGATVLGTLDLTAATAQDCPAVFKARGLSAGTNTVRATLTSGASMTIDSLRVPSSAPVAGLVLGEFPIIPKQTDYANYLTDLIAYKADLAAIIANEYPTFTFLNLDLPSFNPATMYSDDGHHPNDIGAAWIAGLVGQVLNAQPANNGMNILSVASYPAVYAPPTGPGVPSGGQDGTGNPGLTLTPGNAQMALDWSRLSAPVGTTDWSIQYRVSPAGSPTTVTEGSTATTKTITGLTNATAYDFRVASIISGVTGAYTTWVTNTPNLIYATDTFTAADSPTGLLGHVTNTGALTWTILDASTGATWGILSNQAYWSGGAGNSIAVVDAGHADVRLQISLNGVPTSNLGGLVARAQDANNYYVANLRGTGAATHYAIAKRAAGTLTFLADTTTTPTVNDVIQFVVSGTSLTLIVNGTQIATATDSAFTGTKHGFYGSSGGVGDRYDNFSVSAA